MIFKRKKRAVRLKDLEKNMLNEFTSASRFAESYRTLRTNLYFSAMEKEIDSVVVTSSVESEGKSTTSANLGYTMAGADKKVLLIDADLRRPGLTALYSAKGKTGFSDIISDNLGIVISRGNFKEFSIADIVKLTQLQRRSGELKIKSKTESASLFFVDGVLVDIFWRSRPEKKKLANALIRKELLTKEEATLALGEQKKSIQRFGTILRTMGLISKKELLKELSIQMLEAVRALETITEGEFDFVQLNEDKSKLKSASFSMELENIFQEFSGGLSDLKYIKKTLNSAVTATDVENLYFLPSGKIPPNPSEIIASVRTSFVIEFFKDQFDFIIIDTPPVMPALDALIMAPRTSGTILVIKSGNTDKKIVKHCIDTFKQADEVLLGTVLNQVNMKKEGYYRNYNKYYSSYDG